MFNNIFNKIDDNFKPIYLPETVKEKISTEEAPVKIDTVIKERQALANRIDKNLQENEEVLLQNSLLSKQDVKDSLKPLIDLFDDKDFEASQTLALTNLGFSAKGTGYEGWNLTDAAKLYSILFKLFEKKNNVFSSDIASESKMQLISQMQKNLKEIQTSAVNQMKINSSVHLDEAALHMQAVQNLKSGESYCMQGGWASTSIGHAMIYRFEKNANDTFNIYIYEAQEGAEISKGGLKEGAKTITHPYTLLKDVTWEELFFAAKEQKGQPNLFKHLVALQIPEFNKNNFDINDVMACFHHLSHRMVKTSQLPSLFLTMQRSGNCPIKSLNCLLLDQVHQSALSTHQKGGYSQSFYKKLSLDMRLYTILSCYEVFKTKDFHNPAKRDIAILQLKEASKNFLRMLQTNFNRPQLNITEKEYTIASSTIKELFNEIEALEKKITSEKGDERPLRAIEAETQVQAELRQDNMKKMAQASKLTQPVTQAHQEIVGLLDPKLGENIGWKDLPQVIDQLFTKIEILKANENKLPLIFQVESVLRNLAPLKHQACSLSKELALKTLSRLTSIQEQYTYSLGQTETRLFATARITAMEFLALSNILAISSDPAGILKDYCLNTDVFKHAIYANIFYTIQDPLLLEQQRSLQSFFERQKQLSHKRLFNFEFFKINEPDKFLSEESSEAEIFRRYLKWDRGVKNSPISQHYEAYNKDPKKIEELKGKYSCRINLDLFLQDELTNLKESKSPAELRHFTLLKKSSLLAHGICLGYSDTVYREPSFQRDYDPEWYPYDIEDAFLCTAGSSFWVTDERPENDLRLKNPTKWNPYINDDLKLETAYFRQPDIINEYLQNPQASQFLNSEDAKKYHRKALETENALLTSKKHQSGKLFPFYLYLAAPDVQTTLLLDAIENHLDQLSDLTTRYNIRHMLTKIIADKKNIFVSPLIDGFKKNPQAALARFEHLVFTSKTAFIDSMPENQPKLTEMLFVIRQYATALQINRSLNFPFPQKTLKLVEELDQLLMQALKRFNLNNNMQHEIHIARSALLLSLPEDLLKPDQMGALYHSFSNINHPINYSLRHTTPYTIKIEDVKFWIECRRHFFEYDWTKICQTSEDCKKLAEAILRPIIPMESLEWTLENGCLRTKNSDQKWEIDLQTLHISNASGPLTKEKTFFSIPSEFEKLFDKRSHDIQKFGENIWFEDPIWGHIRFTKSDKPSIFCQRLLDNTWYTYVPHEQWKELGINAALAEQHAIWFDPSDPSDIRFDDLKTGKERYRTHADGHIYDNQGFQFVALPSNNPAYQLLTRFEEADFINGWIKNEERKLELPRYKSLEGNPLMFDWDSNLKKWIYPQDPAFVINTAPDKHLGFEVDHFLPLISRDGKKEKWLIPVGQIHAKGYATKAKISPVKLDKSENKTDQGHLFFEYQLVKGEPVGETLESKLYLAHLDLAQKNYGKALSLIKSLSISETLNKTALQFIENLITSANAIKDNSPNACAIRLHCYLMAKRIHPFASLMQDLSQTIALVKEYRIYTRGVNNLQHGLDLTDADQRDLIESIDLETKLSKLNEEAAKQYASYADFIKERRDVLADKNVMKSEKIIVKGYHAPDFPIAAPLIPIGSTDFFDSSRKRGFLGKYQEFATCYNTLKNSTNPSLELKILLYDLMIYNRIDSLDNDRFALLMVAASAVNNKQPLPELPLENASETAKVEWYNKMIELNKLTLQTQDKTPSVYELQERLRKFSTFNREIKRVAQPPTLISKTGELVPTLKSQPILLARQGQDNLFRSWQNAYLLDEEKPDYPGHLFTPSKAESIPLDEKEMGKYKTSIDAHMELYAKDCTLAARKVKKVFSKEIDWEKCIKDVQDEHDTALSQEKDLKHFIKKLANKSPASFYPYVHHISEQMGKTQPKLTMETILRAACQKQNVQALMKLNPLLTEEEASALGSACIEMMIESTHRQHLERILNPLKKWIQTGKKDELLLGEAQKAFNSARSYDPQTQHISLLFEYLSGLRVRTKQAHIINFVLASVLESDKIDPTEKEMLIGKAFQLIMAGGKTSVIISMLIDLIAESGQGLFCCVLSHPSQMASAKGNFADFQSKRFAKDIYVLDYSIKDLSKDEVLDLILKRLKEADRKHCAVLMPTYFSQILELKFIMQLLTLSQITDEAHERKLLNNIDKLREINHLLKEKGVAVFDECDINLSILLDVIIPLGEERDIIPERMDLEKKIFECLLKYEETFKRIGLAENKQADFSEKEIRSQIVPIIAKEMGDYPPLMLQGDFSNLRGAFERFVCDRMSIEDQKLADDLQANFDNLPPEQKENILFLRYLKELADSEDPSKKEAARLICLTAKIATKILPFSLSHSFNRGYGKDPVKQDGSIIPYLASGTPATTQFGNIYLAIAYHMQSALNESISQSEIKFLADQMTESAHGYAQKEKMKLLETVEAKQFKYLTGITLIEANDPDKLRDAYAYINDPKYLKRRIDFAAELTPLHVHYYAENLIHKAINNVSKYKKSIACSGTIWNHATYHRGFGAAALDEGTEGSILNTLASRETPSTIHEIKESRLEDFFDLVRQHPNKAKIRALVDGGGFLKDFNNEKVAREWLQFFEEEKNTGGPPIDAVIYLHKFSKEEIAAGKPKEAFMLLKKGQPQPKMLKNTSRAEIEKHGINIDHLFAFFDEMRTTGSDIPMADDALFLNTVDSHMPIRSFMQAVLRARKIFEGQRSEYIVTQKGRGDMINNGKSFADLKDTLIKNEAILLKDQNDRAYFAQIDDVVRSAIVHELQGTKESKSLKELVFRYRSFLVSHLEDDPYQEMGRIQGKEYTIKALESYKESLWQHFSNASLPNSPILKKVQTELDQLLAKFKKEINHTEEIDFSVHTDLNATIEVQETKEVQKEVQTQLQEEKEIEINLNQEIEMELNRYAISVPLEPYVESLNPLDPSKPLWSQIKKQFEPQKIEVLLNQTYFKSENEVSTDIYASCFEGAPLWATKNFSQTAITKLPIFHPSSKRVGFVLAVPDDQNQYQFVLVSEAEAGHYKTFLEKNRDTKAYLLDLKGIPEANFQQFNAQQDPTFKKEIQKGLWYANFYDGRLGYLEDNKDLSMQLIGKQEPLMARYLQLRIGKDKTRLRELYASTIFTVDFSLGIPISGHTFSWRRDKIAKKSKQKMGLKPILKEIKQAKKTTPQKRGIPQMGFLKKIFQHFK